MFGLVCSLIIYILYTMYLRKRSKIALKFVKMIPKNILCNMKMTSYLRKHKVLNKLDIL